MFEMNNYRLFTVRYFSVRSSISRALPYGWPSWMSVKSTLGGGGGDGLGGGEKIFFLPSSSHHLYTPDARPRGTCETKMAALTSKRSILTILRKNTGQLTVQNSIKIQQQQQYLYYRGGSVLDVAITELRTLKVIELS